MRVTLAELPRHGLDLAVGLETPGFAEAVAEALGGELAALDVKLRIVREAEGLTASVAGHATVRRPCDRCGAPVDVDVPVDTRLAYVPWSEVEESDPDIAEDALDLGFLDGDGKDVEAIVAEAFVLESPRRVTCSGDACPTAIPLDGGEQRGAGASAFAVLKNLK
jgi:uncharacterized metal-binding protein YceD (DUF177 family)